MVGFIREYGQVRQRGNGLQTQVGQGRGFFVFGAGKQAALRGVAHGGFLDADFFGVGDDDVEAAAQRDGNGFVAVAREGELEAGGKRLVQPRGEQAVKRNIGELAQGAQDGFAGCEHQRVFNKRAIGIFQRHGELGGDNGAHQDGLAGAHGQRQDVAGVVEREGFAQGFESVLAYEGVVGLEALQDGIQPVVRNHVHDLACGQTHGFASLFGLWEQRCVKVGNTWCIQHQPQVPIGFQRSELRVAQVAQLPGGWVFDCEVEDFADGGEVGAVVARGAPSVHAFGQGLEKVAHGGLGSLIKVA